jgi:small subunit ribosomal protein S13
MPRILGVDIPANKKVPYSLAHLYGIGLHRAVEICNAVGVDVNRRAFQLSEEELGKVTTYIENNYVIEGNLRREIQANIARFKEIACYRGFRHSRNLPVRGQRTRTNSRTRKGKKKTVANKKILRK